MNQGMYYLLIAVLLENDQHDLVDHVKGWYRKYQRMHGELTAYKNMPKPVTNVYYDKPNIIQRDIENKVSEL